MYVCIYILIPACIYHVYICICISVRTIPTFLLIPMRFRFYCKISDSDTCKHSMFTGIGIGITMFIIVISNYFLALVFLYCIVNKVKKHTKPSVLIAINNDSCCKTELYLKNYSLHNITILREYLLTFICNIHILNVFLELIIH